MCYCDIDSGPSAYWESWPTARKQHTCCECGSSIDPGEKYYKIRGVWDDDFLTFKQCETCQHVWDNVISDGFECICFGELWETVGVEYEI